jgi:molybdopterin molybdotransferase
MIHHIVSWPSPYGNKRGMDWFRAHAIAAAAKPLPAESTSVSAALGRVLAEEIRAVTAVPAFDTAAMDGYAVAGPGPWRLRGQLLAGPATPMTPMRHGTAVEIATGAVVPDGADAVLPYEDSECGGEIVTGSRGRRAHIRRTGEDVRPGEEMVPAGRIVTATVAAAAIQAGVERLQAHRAPSVTLLVTGSEIITSGEPGPGQVRDSFTGLIEAITVRAGARMSADRHIPDVRGLLEEAVAAADTDVIVVSGSSSAGAADHLRAVLAGGHATWHVQAVACRPGHTQSLAALPDGRWVVSLPGNPYAGLIAALTLLEPLLIALGGRVTAANTINRICPVRGEAKLVPGGVRIVPVTAEAEPIPAAVRVGQGEATPTGMRVRPREAASGAGSTMRIVPARGSASLHTAATADALAVLPDDWTDGQLATILTIP